MKNLVKLNAVLLFLIITFSTQSLSAEQILPIPRPDPDKETQIRVSSKKNIIPQKKPDLKKEKVETIENQEAVNADDIAEKNIVIYPEKKPILFVKKNEKIATKSSILSSKDFKIAKASFEAVKNNKWQTALKLSKKSNDKMVFKTVNWLYLIKRNNSATFFDYL